MSTAITFDPSLNITSVFVVNEVIVSNYDGLTVGISGISNDFFESSFVREFNDFSFADYVSWLSSRCQDISGGGGFARPTNILCARHRVFW